MKQNQKGITIVELIVSAALISLVLIGMCYGIIHIKNLYTYDKIHTELLIKQEGVQTEIEKFFRENVLAEVSSCGEDCIRFTFTNAKEVELKSNDRDASITFGGSKVLLTEGTKIGSPQVSIDKTSEEEKRGILTLSISIKHKLVDGDYSVRIAYPYQDHINPIINHLDA